MSLIVGCATCGKKYKVGDDKAGKRIKCGGCGGIIAIPVPAAAASSAEDDLDPWNLPPAEDPNDLDLPPMPRRPGPRKAAAKTSKPSKRGGGVPGWLKILLLVFGVLGGLSLLIVIGIVVISSLPKDGFNFSDLAPKKSAPAAPAPAAPIVWAKHVSPEGQYEIDFPTSNLKFEQIQVVKTVQSKVPGKEQYFSTGFSPAVEEELTAPEKITKLKMIIDEMAKNQQAAIQNTREITVSGHPAIQVEFNKPVGRHIAACTGRYVIVKDRIFQALVVREHGVNLNAETDRFFNSFQVRYGK